MTSVNDRLEVVPINETMCAGIIHIGGKKHLTDFRNREYFDKYYSHQCNGQHTLPYIREISVDDNNRIYAGCTECGHKEYFDNIIYVDAVVADGRTIYIDQPPEPRLGEVFQKSEMYQESLIENETLFQYIVRCTKRFFKK